MRNHVLVASLLLISAATLAADPLPIIDMHLHASAVDAQGPPPIAICAPYQSWPVHDAREPAATYAMRFLKEPQCEKPFWSPLTDEALMKDSIAALERRNVFAVASGPIEIVKKWQKASPRILPAVEFALVPGAMSVDQLRTMLEKKEIVVFGEVINQYFGIAPDDPRFAPYLALLEEYDVPLAIHLGPGPPGSPLMTPFFKDYTAALHNPMTLEPLLRKYPKLRVYAMHAGWPMIDEMIALLYTYPRLYVDIAVLAYAYPVAEFHRYLERLVSAGFGKRILYGSDQMVWPQAIAASLDRVEAAPFLTTGQKRDIFYNNAARFLRLSDAEIAKHHGK